MLLLMVSLFFLLMLKFLVIRRFVVCLGMLISGLFGLINCEKLGLSEVLVYFVLV